MDNIEIIILIISNIVLMGAVWQLSSRLTRTSSDLGNLVRKIAEVNYFRQHPDSNVANRAMIIIPAYREAENIPQVLSSIPAEIEGYKLMPLVVVDGYDDNTEQIVQEMGYRAVTHVMNRGQGSALRTGFEVALREKAEVIITMDADGQHRPEDLPLLLQPIRENTADYVMGSRFMGDYQEKHSARHAGILFYSWLISALIRSRITDCTNGFRAIRASKLAILDLREERFNAPELIIQAKNKGLRIMEVPVTILKRAQGESKKPRRLGYPLRFGFAMLRAWLR